MWWRLTNAQFKQQQGAANKQAMRVIVEAGTVPGLLAYDKDRPVGWCALAPREKYPRLGRSRILAPVDDTPVWSVICCFVDKQYRRRGVSRDLLEAAKRWVRRQGGSVLEGYPVEPKQEQAPPLFVFTGLASAFVKAGFEECARRSPTRPVMRARV